MPVPEVNLFQLKTVIRWRFGWFFGHLEKDQLKKLNNDVFLPFLRSNRPNIDQFVKFCHEQCLCKLFYTNIYIKGYYSHSMVAGGLLEISRQTRLAPLTSLMMRLDIFSRTS